jgi:hypothetical protein
MALEGFYAWSWAASGFVNNSVLDNRRLESESKVKQKQTTVVRVTDSRLSNRPRLPFTTDPSRDLLIYVTVAEVIRLLQLHQLVLSKVPCAARTAIHFGEARRLER